MRRDRETTCREEIYRQPQHRRAGQAQRADPKGQSTCPTSAESTRPAEGGRVGGGGSVERRPDRRGAGYQPRHHRAHAPATGRGWDRRSANPQAIPQLRPKAHLRRRRRGQANRPRLFCAAEGAQAVDADAAGNCRGGAEHRRPRQRQHDRAYAQKNILKPHLQKQWVIPPAANAAFVAAMEDVLEVYQRPHDPDRPVVCLDETTKQLVKETRMPVPATPGRATRHDYEYERNGTINLFMLFAPLEGWRHVGVTAPHTAPV